MGKFSSQPQELKAKLTSTSTDILTATITIITCKLEQVSNFVETKKHRINFSLLKQSCRLPGPQGFQQSEGPEHSIVPDRTKSCRVIILIDYLHLRVYPEQQLLVV